MWISSGFFPPKLNIFGLWTKKDIWGRHFGLWETLIDIYKPFSDITTNRLIDTIMKIILTCSLNLMHMWSFVPPLCLPGWYQYLMFYKQLVFYFFDLQMMFLSKMMTLLRHLELLMQGNNRLCQLQEQNITFTLSLLNFPLVIQAFCLVRC